VGMTLGLIAGIGVLLAGLRFHPQVVLDQRNAQPGRWNRRAPVIPLGVKRDGAPVAARGSKAYFAAARGRAGERGGQFEIDILAGLARRLVDEADLLGGGRRDDRGACEQHRRAERAAGPTTERPVIHANQLSSRGGADRRPAWC
jgi:hypothetical protein